MRPHGMCVRSLRLLWAIVVYALALSAMVSPVEGYTDELVSPAMQAATGGTTRVILEDRITPQRDHSDAGLHRHRVASSTLGPIVAQPGEAGPLGRPSTARPHLAQVSTEALLKSKWGEMKAALMAKDIERALGFILHTTRPRYRALFTTLGDHLPEVARDLPDVELIYIQGNDAKGRMRRTEPYGGQQVTFSYYIYFVQDAAGDWYIKEF